MMVHLKFNLRKIHTIVRNKFLGIKEPYAYVIFNAMPYTNLITKL